MGYINYEGTSTWSPCDDCKDKSCYSCIVVRLEKLLKEERTARNSAEFKIETELKPRIEAEKRSYDSYVTTDRMAEVCYAFNDLIDSLMEMVEENFDGFDWDDENGDLEEKILHLIKKELEGADKQ